MTANSGYYRGAPKASELKVQELNENQKLEAVLSGAVDITQLTATPEAFFPDVRARASAICCRMIPVFSISASMRTESVPRICEKA